MWLNKAQAGSYLCAKFMIEQQVAHACQLGLSLFHLYRTHEAQRMPNDNNIPGQTRRKTGHTRTHGDSPPPTQSACSLTFRVEIACLQFFLLRFLQIVLLHARQAGTKSQARLLCIRTYWSERVHENECVCVCVKSERSIRGRSDESTCETQPFEMTAVRGVRANRQDISE